MSEFTEAVDALNRDVFRDGFLRGCAYVCDLVARGALGREWGPEHEAAMQEAWNEHVMMVGRVTP